MNRYPTRRKGGTDMNQIDNYFKLLAEKDMMDEILTDPFYCPEPYLESEAKGFFDEMVGLIDLCYSETEKFHLDIPIGHPTNIIPSLENCKNISRLFNLWLDTCHMNGEESKDIKHVKWSVSVSKKGFCLNVHSRKGCRKVIRETDTGYIFSD
jgi:hypothetical protein